MSLLSPSTPESRRRLLYGIGALTTALLITAGIFASNNWFPSTDPLSGKRTGWFGRTESTLQRASSAAAPPGTPQLSKEYIYAGSRLLAVEDANASAAPPSDLAVWRPSTGQWWVLGGPGSSGVVFPWGQAGDKPIPGDFDGDGKTDFSVFRPTPEPCTSCPVTWYIVHSSTGAWSVFQYAQNGDLPAQADYDGDGRTDAAVYRPPSSGIPNGVWYIQSTSSGYYTQTWGEAGDIPASADYDGDGRADIGIWRPSNRTFYSIHSSNNNIVNHAGNIPAGTDWETVSSDYDGDGRADYAVYERTTATWYVRQSSTGTFNPPLVWGAGGDKAVHNDYDGDGRTDYAAWTPSGPNVGRWHIKNSSNGSTRDVNWGILEDVPVPALYRR